MPIIDHAAATPDRIATIMAGSGESLTYGELNERSIRLAHHLHASGLRPGDVVALFMENNIRYHEVYWAVVRSGMYVCAVNKFLTAEEVVYIVNDSGSKALITSAALGPIARDLLGAIEACPVRLMIDGVVAGYDCYEDAIAKQPTEPLAQEPRGDFMNYSSGTTGRPKGIKRPLSGEDFAGASMLDILVEKLYQVGTETVYLSPAPLYHAAPLGFTAAVHSLGGTNVIMEKFDPVASLRLIEKHRVTHSQWVPTMFIRMLKLDAADRAGHDLSSHQIAIHAAAPCPIDVKHQMIDWWGPIIWEYYGGTELNGMTVCNSEQWLAHPGSVGSSIMGVLHICDEAGKDLPAGETGTIYFERDIMPFQYHGDPEKTEAARHPKHPFWTKLGDVGYLDEDGFLYLTDRESFMIISGGVNIYPQESENALITHPAVIDVAVFGVPNEEFGEEVKAVVQLADFGSAGPALAAELMNYARQKISHIKCPRSIDFIAELPRHPTGKLYKRLLKDKYWETTS